MVLLTAILVTTFYYGFIKSQICFGCLKVLLVLKISEVWLVAEKTGSRPNLTRLLPSNYKGFTWKVSWEKSALPIPELCPVWRSCSQRLNPHASHVPVHSCIPSPSASIQGPPYCRPRAKASLKCLCPDQLTGALKRLYCDSVFSTFLAPALSPFLPLACPILPPKTKSQQETFVQGSLSRETTLCCCLFFKLLNEV